MSPPPPPPPPPPLLSPSSDRSYKLYLYHANTQREVAGSPIGFDVLPAAADAASSTHNIDFDELESRKTADVELELRVDPFDRFNNTLPTAAGYAVAINGGDPIPLLAPSFSYSHIIPRGFSDTLNLNFTLDGTPIANSPVTVAVSPDWTVMYVGAASSVLLLLVLAIFFIYRRLKSEEMHKMGARMNVVHASQKRLESLHEILELEKEALAEEVRLKKHSEEELKVMVEAMQEVSKERQDELKEVMLDSKELKVEKLLGKGG